MSDKEEIFTRDQSVMLKTLFRLFGCRVHRDLGSRRLAGLYPARQSLAEHTDRAELHCSREFTAAARAGALELRAHSPSRPPSAIRAKNTPLHRVVENRASTAPGKLFSRSTSN